MFVCVIVGGKKNCKMVEVGRIKALITFGILRFHKINVFNYQYYMFNKISLFANNKRYLLSSLSLWLVFDVCVFVYVSENSGVLLNCLYSQNRK